MSQTVEQIYLTNPTTVVADTDLYYLVQSPYTPGSDAAISGASLKSAFGTGGTINPGLINQLGYYAATGSTISGLATLANGTLITSAGGAPSISQTLPIAVQGNITSLGTISSGIWNGTVITGTYGGSGVNNGANTATYAGNLNFASSFTTSGAFAVTQTYTGITNVTFPTSGTLATTSELPTPAALTRVDDTNVTLTLGGTPSTALLQATSLTLGWTGTLSGTRGGTGVNNGTSTITIGGNVTFSGAFTFAGTLTGNTSVTFPTSGTLATTSQIPTGAALTKTDDTNVTLTLGGSPTTALVNAASLTLGWTGQLGLTRGGTAASLTASNGGIVWSNATQMQILSGTATARQMLQSGSTATPAWSTSTWPATTTINRILFSSANNTVGEITTANSGVLITDGSGVPSIATQIVASNLPSGSMFNFQSTNTTTVSTSSSNSMADVTNLSVAITPTSSSNKVLVRAVVQVGCNTTSEIFLQLVRGSTAIGLGAAAGSRTLVGAAGNSMSGTANMQTLIMEFLDTPATTSSTTYKVQFASDNNISSVAVNSSVTDTNTANFPRASSTISVCEIKA